MFAMNKAWRSPPPVETPFVPPRIRSIKEQIMDGMKYGSIEMCSGCLKRFKEDHVRALKEEIENSVEPECAKKELFDTEDELTDIRMKTIPPDEEHEWIKRIAQWADDLETIKSYRFLGFVPSTGSTVLGDSVP